MIVGAAAGLEPLQYRARGLSAGP